MRSESQKRRLMYGSNALIFLLILLTILIVVNYLANQHPHRMDLTENKRQSLSEQTVKLIHNLQQPVTILCFYKEDDPQKAMLENLLNIYQYHSEKIDVQFVDPDKSPGLTEEYGVRTYQTIIVTQNDRRERATQPNESKITNAILRITREKDKTIYFLTGHNEHELDKSDQLGYAELRQAVINNDYSVKTLALATEEKVPDDCTVLVIGGPRSELFPEEIEKIKQYLNNGGRLLLMIDPMFEDTGLHEFIVDWSIQIDDDRIIDPMSRLAGADLFVPIVDQYDPTHPITKDFNVYTIFPFSRSLSLLDFTGQHVRRTVLARTGQNSWGETHPDSVQFDENADREGPLNIAAAVEKARPLPQGATADTTLPTSRLVVIGNSNFVNNAYFFQGGNRDFFMNTLSWLAGDEDLISIRPREQHERRLNMTAMQASMLFWISVVFVPTLVLLAGGIVWWLKR